MTRFVLLLGSAPEGFRQKKIEEMFDFLDSKRNAGDSIVTFANGISELMLEVVLDNSMKQLTENSEQTTGLNVRHCEPQQDCHCERSEAILESDVEDCFVADAPRNDVVDNNAPRNDVADSNASSNNENSNSILLYICTLRPVAENEKSFWLSGEEIRCDVIRHYQELAEECEIDMQVVMDFDSEMMREDELGWEEVREQLTVNRFQNTDNSEQKTHRCERSEAILETDAGDCFVANAPRNDTKLNNLRQSAESAGDCNV